MGNPTGHALPSSLPTDQETGPSSANAGTSQTYEGDSKPQKQTPKLPVPPLLLLVGTILWRAFGYAERIDFILKVEDQTFAVIFQSFVSYGWLLLTVGAVIWGLIAYRMQRGAGEEAGFKATPGMVVSVGVLAFLYGILLAVTATGSIPNVTAGWGPTATGCNIVVDTSRLDIFRKQYYLVGICGISDPTVDKLQQTGITISKPFTITPGGVAISALYSPEMVRAVNPPIAPVGNSVTNAPGTPLPGSEHGVGTGAGLVPQGSTVALPPMWYQPVLVPKDADLSKITTLGDVKRQGGKILSSSYYE